MKKVGIILLAVLFIWSCNNSENQSENIEGDGVLRELTVFHAGSLSVPFKEIKKAFEQENPNVEILLEAAGSRDCARKITDLHRECDVMASADYRVIENLLIPDFAEWYINFASNEMAIVYTEKSRYSNQINKNNWFEILQKEDVIFGRSEPNSDPCGYRAVLTVKLAEQYYKVDSLSEILLEKDNNFIRPKEVDLISLLESNALDYIFLYRSVAEQHKLDYLVLPDSINLKNSQYESFYNSENIEITGKKPGELISKKGEAMIYGLTILSNAKNPELALKFVDFILNGDYGIQIIERNGQPSVVPAYSTYYIEIPDLLKKYALNH